MMSPHQLVGILLDVVVIKFLVRFILMRHETISRGFRELRNKEFRQINKSGFLLTGF
jgi:hypothetical protein